MSTLFSAHYSVGTLYNGMVKIFDTEDPLETLHAQLLDMQCHNSTRIAFALASPGNRQFTARGGYDHESFSRMVRNPTYAPLLAVDGNYDIVSSWRSGNGTEFTAFVCIGSGHCFRFGMSLVETYVVDEHESLAPYELRPGHPPVWRTDSVVPVSATEVPRAPTAA